MIDSDSPTQWTKLSLNFTEQNHGIKLIFDEIDSAHSGLCFSNISITHSVYKITHIIVTANLQNIIYTSMGDDINVTINSLYLFIPNLIPSVETQLIFTEATQNNYKISFDE